MAFNRNDIIDGLEALCLAHTSLGTGKFFRDYAEFQSKMRGTGGFCMLISPSKGRLNGQNESAIYKYETITFCINKPYQVGNYDQKQTILDDCEEIAMDIIKRIRHYSLALEGTPGLFANFKFQSVQFEEVDLEFDNRIGWDVSLEIFDQISLAWDPTDTTNRWSDV